MNSWSKSINIPVSNSERSEIAKWVIEKGD